MLTNFLVALSWLSATYTVFTFLGCAFIEWYMRIPTVQIRLLALGLSFEGAKWQHPIIAGAITFVLFYTLS